MAEVRRKVYSYKNFEVKKCFKPKLEAYYAHEMTANKPDSRRKVYVLRLFKYEFTLSFRDKS